MGVAGSDLVGGFDSLRARQRICQGLGCNCRDPNKSLWEVQQGIHPRPGGGVIASERVQGKGIVRRQHQSYDYRSVPAPAAARAIDVMISPC